MAAVVDDSGHTLEAEEGRHHRLVTASGDAAQRRGDIVSAGRLQRRDEHDDHRIDRSSPSTLCNDCSN